MWEIAGYVSGTDKNPCLGDIEKSDWKLNEAATGGKSQIMQILLGVLRFGNLTPKVKVKK